MEAKYMERAYHSKDNELNILAEDFSHKHKLPFKCFPFTVTLYGDAVKPFVHVINHELRPIWYKHYYLPNAVTKQTQEYPFPHTWMNTIYKEKGNKLLFYTDTIETSPLLLYKHSWELAKQIWNQTKEVVSGGTQCWNSLGNIAQERLIVNGIMSKYMHSMAGNVVTTIEL
jgi:hypothetical protein